MKTRFRIGERLAADKLNGLVTDIEDAIKVRTDGSIIASQGPEGISLAVNWPKQGELFFNNYGDTIPAFSLMAVTGGDVLPSLEPFLKCSQVGSTFPLEIAVNGDQDVGPDDFGRCFRSGPVRLSLGSSAAFSFGDFYGVQPSSFLPDKNYPACFQVDNWWDADNYIANGFLFQIRRVLAKLTGTGPIVTPGTSDTFTLWHGAAGSEAEISGWTVSGSGRFEPVDKTGLAWLELNNGIWYAVESEHLALQIGGLLGGTLTTGSSVSTCSVAWYDNGKSPGSTVTVYSHESIFTGVSGTAYRAEFNRTDGKYYFVWVGC